MIVDAGDGNNAVSVTLADIYPYVSFYGASISTGAGSDTISVVGGLMNVIDAGAGNDTIMAGSGTDTITMGAGADDLLIDRSIFTSLTGPIERLTVNDFSLADGDALTLSNWNIPALGATGILDDAADLQALRTAGGDVLSFVQVGTDALLSLSLGGGEIAEILFKNLDISAAPPPPPPPPPTDPKMTLNGTYGNDVLIGGNNDDIIFLRRGHVLRPGAMAPMFSVSTPSTRTMRTATTMSSPTWTSWRATSCASTISVQAGQMIASTPRTTWNIRLAPSTTGLPTASRTFAS